MRSLALSFFSALIIWVSGCEKTPTELNPENQFPAKVKSGATRQEIQEFIGNENSLRISFLMSPERRSPLQLVSIDLNKMESDSFNLKIHELSQSALVPSMSPDGEYVAYHIGKNESRTISESRIFIQPIDGSQRIDGPASPATNPRWWWDDQDTALVWCDSAEQNGWTRGGSTWKQLFSGGKLIGTPEKLADGNFNGGLSPDGNYLAAGYTKGVMLNRKNDSLKMFHAYSDIENGNDTLQVCNVSISSDPALPSRMLFLDFGVNAEHPYDNIINRAAYKQHQLILIGDFQTVNGGGIVDFIDTPEELQYLGTWEDPEWTTHSDYISAVLRVPSQFATMDLYLIKISTKQWIKIAEVSNPVQPVAWIGAK